MAMSTSPFSQKNSSKHSKNFDNIKIIPIFVAPKKEKGLVVQLVRIHACHAWGRGFESRPDRKEKKLSISKMDI